MASPTESPEVTEGLRLFKLVMYIIIFVISLPANVLMLLAVSRKAYRHWNTAKSYICLIQNLAVADVLLVFFSIPFDLAWHEAQRFTFGDFMCRVLWPVQTCSLQAIVFLYLALMAHRSVGVMGNLYGQLKYRHTVWLSLFLWLLAFCTVIPYIVFLKHDDLRQTCEESWPQFEHRQVYTVALFLFQYGIPLVIMIGMIIYVWEKLGKYKIMEPVRAKKRERHRSVTNMLLAFTLVFAVLLLPHQIMWFILDFGEGDSLPHFWSTQNVLYILTYSITIANPILFYFYNKEFQRDFAYFLKFKCVRRQTEDDVRDNELSESFSQDGFDGPPKGAYAVDGGYYGKSGSQSMIPDGNGKNFDGSGYPLWDRDSRYGSQNTLDRSSSTPRTPGGDFKMEMGLFTSTLDRCKSADKRMSDIRTSTSLASRSRQSLAGSESDNSKYAAYQNEKLDLGYDNRLSDEFL